MCGLHLENTYEPYDSLEAIEAPSHCAPFCAAVPVVAIRLDVNFAPLRREIKMAYIDLKEAAFCVHQCFGKRFADEHHETNAEEAQS